MSSKVYDADIPSLKQHFTAKRCWRLCSMLARRHYKKSHFKKFTSCLNAGPQATELNCAWVVRDPSTEPTGRTPFTAPLRIQRIRPNTYWTDSVYFYNFSNRWYYTLVILLAPLYRFKRKSVNLKSYQHKQKYMENWLYSYIELRSLFMTSSLVFLIKKIYIEWTNSS